MLRTRAELDEAVAERALVEAPPRPEDVAAAEGRVAAAEARLRGARHELAKTRVVAPSDGCVLQVCAEPGEMAGPGETGPVLRFADLSRYRVRAFIEELDAARVQPGQAAVVTADGLPGREFRGTVAEVLPRMGQRAAHSDAPGEYKDQHYREVLIDLDAWDGLALNLRVQVYVHIGPG
jgi:multidrug resistance efflux pump